MNYTDLQLTKISASDAAEAGLRCLYESAFPPEERRPWQALCELPAEFSIYGITCNGEMAGMLTLWLFDNEMAYIEHFAVFDHMRGSGMGAAALSKIRDLASPLPVVLEVEPDGTTPFAARRIAFYSRNGFDAYDYEYIQPPYSAGLPSVRLTLMSTDPSLDPGKIASRLHCDVYGVI